MDAAPAPPVLRARNLLVDALIALAMTAISVSIFVSFQRSGTSLNAAPAVALMLVHGLCLAGRRKWPELVVGVQVVSGLAVVLLGFPPVALGVAILVGLYTVAAYRPVSVSLPALVVVELVATDFLWISESGPGPGTTIGNALVLMTTWYLGYSTYSRRLYAEKLERRNAELERAREELERSVVTKERLRIARELHDVIGHSMSSIAVQSGVGAHVIDRDPEAGKHALLMIESTSKSALAEIRRVLGVMRDNGQEPELAPAPGVEGLEELVREMSSSGVDVDLQVSDTMSGLPPGMETTIYRIVQEALTNVIKHARATRARVVLTGTVDGVAVEVVDNGAGHVGGSTDGHGLIGMRERVDLFGGELLTGPLPDGGYRVAAKLPLPELT